MEFRQQQSIYLQIADHICEKILRKELKAHEKVPSVRELAVSVEVNPNTVARTYIYLEEKGIIYKERGIGYFVAVDGFNNALSLKKDIFLNEIVPIVFKNLKLLDIEISHLEALYKKHK